MSTFNIPDASEVSLITPILAQNMTLKLFKNDVLQLGSTPLNAAAIAALTVSAFTEANFTGYTAKALTGGSWTITGGAPTQGTYTQQTFTSTATQTAQTIYGYYFVYTTGGALVGFRQFDVGTNLVIQNNGDVINLTPKITLSFV